MQYQQHQRHGSVRDNPHYFTRRGGPWCEWRPSGAPPLLRGREISKRERESAKRRAILVA